MKNSDLKDLIQSAFTVEPSVRKKDFIKKHQKRLLNYREMLRFQLQYMGVQLIAVGGYVMAILLGLVTDTDADLVRVLSFFAPVAALVALTGLGKSARYEMEEIEMSSRFSLRMISIMRISIVGIAGFAVMLSISCALRLITGMDFFISFAMASIPYLITTFLCMIIIRKWHSPKNIYGCAAIAVSLCFLSFPDIRILEKCSVKPHTMILFFSLLLSLIMTAVEIFRYINESEEVRWNLCWTE